MIHSHLDRLQRTNLVVVKGKIFGDRYLMTDNSGKTWMAIGETDDPNAIIETFTADAAITKGDPVYLSADDQVTPAGAAQDCIGIAMKTVADTEPVRCLFVVVSKLLQVALSLGAKQFMVLILPSGS